MMDSFLGGLHKGPRTFVACTKCNTTAEQVEALQRYVDTNSDEPIDSLRQHSNVAMTGSQTAAQSGPYVTREELAETTKSATAEVLMAITETWKKKPEEQTGTIQDRRPDESNKNKEKVGTPGKGNYQKPFEGNPRFNQGNDSNQHGHQNVVNNRYQGPARDNTDRRVETRVCYNCNTPGHLSANCRRRRDNGQNGGYNRQNPNFQ